MLFSIRDILFCVDKVFLIKKSKDNVFVQRNVTNFVCDPIKLTQYINTENIYIEETNIKYEKDTIFEVLIVFISESWSKKEIDKIREVEKEEIIEEIIQKYKNILNK